MQPQSKSSRRLQPYYTFTLGIPLDQFNESVEDAIDEWLLKLEDKGYKRTRKVKDEGLMLYEFSTRYVTISIKKDIVRLFELLAFEHKLPREVLDLEIEYNNLLDKKQGSASITIDQDDLNRWYMDIVFTDQIDGKYGKQIKEKRIRSFL